MKLGKRGALQPFFLMYRFLERTDDEALRLLADAVESSIGDDSAEKQHHEDENSSISCSSGVVNLEILNGGDDDTEVEGADDADTIDEDQPDEDADMIMVTHVSSHHLT